MSKSNPLERAFLLLDIVASANREMPLIEIVQTSGLPQSSVFRLTSNLVESEMLAFNPRSKTYRAGTRALRLSLLLNGHRKLGDVIGPALEAVSQATEETSFFVVRSAEGNKLFRYLVPELGARSFVHPGFAFPAHATAAGKVIASFAQEDNLLATSREPLERFQKATITNPRKLAKLFATIRKQGYAVNDSELDKDVYSVCAPVFFAGEIAGALGFVGARDRVLAGKNGRIADLIGVLRREADQLSLLLKA